MLKGHGPDGDGGIGCWNPVGTLRIIDRMKDIFKLSQGKYVAPEKIGGVYIKNKDLKASFEKLCASDSPTGAELKADISRDMDRQATEYKLSALSASRISRALREDHARITPTFKLKRLLIVQIFGSELDGMLME
ncbi:hypothetical protein PR003_g17720 [Phytophthora rubi]|uniref:Uncharacterized protein n=1 Tax=Phytophthora rubi TaxID=129364 RepID=A0A6A4ECS0_9STRA|nr:hypothetical protein PR002_g17060 [Phytophthora rubi]KAE9320403.1 hypothetical protein PR003_g17720 [Phytophthora rubi]